MTEDAMTGYPDPNPPASDELTQDEAAILELERSWWKYAGAKENLVYDRFQWSMTRYDQVLNTLIDNPTALAADPVTINRLRRLRDNRRSAR